MTDIDQEAVVASRLRELGIEYTRHEHPPVATVEEANAHWSGIDATHCKNLFLRNQKGNRHYLVVMMASKRADLRAVAEKNEVIAAEWVTFPGGELEGKRPKALCPACRDALNRESSTTAQPGGRRPRPLCFDCYRVDLARTRALKAAGELDTASVARFQ